MATAADNEGRDGNTTSLLYQTCHRQLVAQDKERLAKLNVPVSDDEADRLHFLRATNLLDTPQSDAMFDRFCSLTKRLFNVPFALINLIDVDRAFVKSNFGLPGLKEAPRDQDSPEVFVVEDTLLDPRFVNFGVVAGPPHVRFYAGTALVINNVRVGTLCTMDIVPREFSSIQRVNLLDLGAAVAHLIQERYEQQQNKTKETAKLLVDMFHNIRAPVAAINQAADVLLQQQQQQAAPVAALALALASADQEGGDAAAAVAAAADADGHSMNHDLLDAVGRLSLIWESSMTLGAFIMDKVESANFRGSGGFLLCDVLSTVKDARHKLERLPAAGNISWNVNHAVFALAKNHISCPKALFFLLLDYVGQALDAWEDVTVSIQFAPNDDDVENEGVTTQIESLPETDGYARWCHGRLEVSIALAKRRPVDGSARVSQHYTLVQVLKDVGGVFEEAGTGETDSGGRLLSEVAMAWMPCAVLIDDEGLAIAAEAAPATLRSTSRRGVVTAEDQTRTPPEPLLTLPVQSSGEGGGRHVPSQEPPTHRLLLVEDSLALQKMLTRFFQRHGYTVTVANNGREGLELLTSQPFHICFMDFLMPVMSGPECMVQYAEWRDGVEEGDTSRSFNDDMLLIGMSANAVSGDLETGYDCGMAFYCPKPTSADMLSFILKTRKEQHTLAETVDIISADAKGLYTPRVGLLEEIIHQSTAKGDIMEQYVDPAVQAKPAPGATAPSSWPHGTWQLFRRRKSAKNAVVPAAVPSSGGGGGGGGGEA